MFLIRVRVGNKNNVKACPCPLYTFTLRNGHTILIYSSNTNDGNVDGPEDRQMKNMQSENFCL